MRRCTGLVARTGNAAVTIEYAGTSPGAIGLFQFNLVVPSGVSGDLPFTIAIDGADVARQPLLAVE